MIDQRLNSASAAEANAVDVLYLLSVLWRGKVIILICTMFTLLASGYYLFNLSVPLYRATAVVMLNNREEQVVDLGSVVGGLGGFGGDRSVVNTELQVLRSRNLLGQVVDTLDLTAEPQFNPGLKELTLKDRISYRIKNVLSSNDDEPSVVEAEPVQQAREQAIDLLLESLSIRNVPDSLVFEVIAISGEPQLASEVANTVVDTYINDQLSVKLDATEQASSWLSNRVAELKIELEEADARVADFRARNDVPSLESSQVLEFQVTETRERIAQIRERANDVSGVVAAANSPEEIVEILDDTQLRNLLPQIEDPEIRTQFDATVVQILNDLARDRVTAQRQVTALEASLATLEARLSRQNADLITLQQLTREAEASRLLYEYFLSRLKETSAQRGIHQADSRVLSKATPPLFAFSPRKGINLILAAIAGLFLGGVWVLLREQRNLSFRTSEDIEAFTGINVLGQIPDIKHRDRRDLLHYLAEKPTSGPAEAVRNLRTSLLLQNIDHPPQVIMTCSSQPGEGKTTLAIALALNMATMGRKTLLVEADVRRRVFVRYFENSQIPKDGYKKALEEGGDYRRAIAPIREVGCDVLFGGESEGNPADLFSSKRFETMIKELRETYDQIVIDTPPILLLPDARIVAQHADSIALAVHWNNTPRMQVMAALNEFSSAGRPVNGIVLNRIDPRGMRRYGGNGRYGSYVNYTSPYYEN